MHLPADAMIEGVSVVPLRQFPDERGTVYHMLKATDPHYVQFGEIYFSSVYPGVVKAWKRHRRLTSNYACIVGKIRLVLYDDRADAASKGALTELVIGPERDDYVLAVIPPFVWHGFQGMAGPVSVLANCATGPHDPDELDRVDPSANEIPYTWLQPG